MHEPLPTLPAPTPSARRDAIDAFLDPGIRAAIERAWLEPIGAQSSLAEALKDPRFLDGPSHHAALFADHGVVHARDVAGQLLQVLDTVNGRLIPARGRDRLDWMKAYGVLLAMVHDMGMVDPTPVGRAMHPEFATQTVLGRGFDAIVAAVWGSGDGVLASRLLGLAADGALGAREPQAVLREMLAMANCHSKSKVPIRLLNDRPRLRQAMIAAARTDLAALYAAQREPSATLPEPSSDDPAFAWLNAPDGPVRALVDDIVDTIRALRCADSLRQRGTELKTSANYEVFVDRRTANAVYALRPDEEHLYLLEVPDPISAGESNLSSSQLEADGNLRISFYHGLFQDAETVERAARSAALVVNDIQADAIGSFEFPGGGSGGSKPLAAMAILIEAQNENPAFAGLVHRELATLNPAAAARVRVVPSLEVGSPVERAHYVHGTALDWSLDRRREVLTRVAAGGHRTGTIDPVAAFREVRRISVAAGETLIEAGTPSGFVYVPLDEGLRGLPLGGYGDFDIKPWVLLGVTGIIRGAIRNATVVADRDVSLLAMPRDAFLAHWHSTYDAEAFAALFRDGPPA